MKKNLTLLFVLISFFTVRLVAQNTVLISGKVTDQSTGESLPGASVYVKGNTTMGISTNDDGTFMLQVPAEGSILVVSSVGYSSAEIETTGKTIINIALTSLDQSLDAVVISASRKQEKILDAPASITLITTKQITNTVALSPTDNLKGVPGVDIMNTGLVQTNVVTRGFNNIFSGALLTMVDNRYATVPSLRVNVNMFIPTDNTDLERIEVLRGPASALYGPNCSNGVLHMITKSPLDQEQQHSTSASIGFGFRSKIDGPIAIEDTINPLFDYDNLFSTNRWNADSIADDRMLYSAAFRHAWKINDKIGLKILGTYFSGNDWRYDDPLEPERILKGYQTTNGRVNDADSIDNIRNTELEKIGIDARLDIRPKQDMQLIFAGGMTQNDGIELTGIGAGQAVNWKYYYTQARFNYKNLFAQVFMNGSNSGDTYILRTGDYITDESKVYAGQLQYANQLFEKKLDLVYGIDAILTRPNTNSTINGRYETDDNITEIGGYAQGDYKINDHFNVIAALRLDHHNFVEDPFLSPRAAFIYKPNARQTFRATFNRSFSAPSSNNLNLDILQLGDLGDLGVYGQNFFGMDYLPSIGARAVGNRGGFTFSYDENGLPQYHSAYSQYIGNDMNQYYSLGSNNQLNNITWDVAVGLLLDGIAEATNINIETITLLFDPILPDSIAGIGNSVKLLNLTTKEFELIDASSVQDFGAIRNSPTNTIEVGWKGALLGDKLFATIDVYQNRMQDFVSPLTNITPNVFLESNTLTDYVAPYITAIYNDPTYYVVKGLIDGSLDENGDGSGLEEFIATVVGAGSGVPMGTVVPTQFNDASIYVTYVNIGDVSVYGTDIGLTYYANEDLKLSAAYSWVDKDSIPLEGAQFGYVALNAPKNKFGFRASLDIDKIEMNVGLNFRWQASFPANSGAYVGTVEQVHDMDLTLNYTPHWWQNSMFSLAISNLYNHEQQYFVGAPVMGRTTFFKVSKTF